MAHRVLDGHPVSIGPAAVGRFPWRVRERPHSRIFEASHAARTLDQLMSRFGIDAPALSSPIQLDSRRVGPGSLFRGDSWPSGGWQAFIEQAVAQERPPCCRRRTENSSLRRPRSPHRHGDLPARLSELAGHFYGHPAQN